MKRFATKQTGVLSASELKTIGGKTTYWFFFTLLVICAAISLLPAVWTVLTAFKDTQEIYSAFSFFPKNMTFHKIVERITESWQKLNLGKSVVNTVVLTLGEIGFKIVVCGFGGYVLSKLKPSGSKLVFALVVWTMMMPGQIRLVPNYISYLHFPFAYDIGGVSLLDTYWPMWFGAAADTYSVLLFKNAFDGLSESYVEAAKIDGCSNYGVFFKIMLPLSLPIMIYVSITTVNRAWSDFFNPLLILDKNVVLPLQLYRLKSDQSIQMNTYFMALVMASLPTFLVFAVFQRQIMGGVNVGGVKG